jgi:hypothetical protein
MNTKISLLLILVVAVVIGGVWYTFSYSTGGQTSDQTATTHKACETNSDCSTGESCLTSGPLIAGQQPHKYCYPAGEVAPL